LIRKIRKQKNNNKVFGNYLFLLLVQGSNFIISLVLYPYLVNVLGLEKFGIVMVANSFIVFINIMVDFGFEISATREVAIIKNDKEKLSSYFWNVFFSKMTLLVFSFSILLLLTIIFNKFKEFRWVYLFSFGIVVGQSIFPYWFYQGIEKMKMLTFANVFARITFILLSFIFITKPSDYIYVPVFNSLGFIISGIIGLIISLKYVTYKKPQLKVMKGFIKENSHLIASNFFTSIYQSGSTFILGMIGGNNIAGVYSSMEKLIIALRSVFKALYQAIFPWISAKSEDFIFKFIKQLKKFILFAGILISLIIFFASNLILKIVFHNQTILHYSNVFRILGLIALFTSLNLMYVQLLFPALKSYKYRMIPIVGGGLSSLILVLIGAYFFGIYGVAVAAVLSEIIILVIAVYLFKKIIK